MRSGRSGGSGWDAMCAGYPGLFPTAPPGGGGGRRAAPPREGARPRPRGEQAADRLEGRRLAGAIRADQGDDLALANLEGDALEGAELAVAGGGVGQLREDVV